MKFQQEYKNIITESFDSCKNDAAMMREAIEKSSAHYHGYTVHSLYIPKMYTENDLKIFNDAAVITHRILEKLIQHYIDNPEYRKLFGFDKRLEELILRPVPYKCLLPIARIDIFYNPETKDFKFCEFNTDGSSGMNEDRELNNVFAKSDTFNRFSENHSIKTFELFDSWVKEFDEMYRSCGSTPKRPYAAIVDFMSSASNEEFEEFRRAFIRSGYYCEICDIYKLRRENGALVSPSGRKIDVVYRRAVTCDIMNNYDKVRPFIDAALNNEVVLIGDFRTQIVHNKLIFKIMRNEMTKKILTHTENDFIEKHIPATYALTHDNIKAHKVIENKNKWIVKPEDSYASKGVLAGIEAKTTEQWRSFLEDHADTDYLLQEYITPYETENIDLIWDRSADFRGFANITGLFVYNGKLKGLYSRIAKSGVISTQYSEMTLPTMIVKSK